MTLLYTEIFPNFPDGHRYIFFASDRKISLLGGQLHSMQKKIFEIPYLPAAIGMFGLAEFSIGARTYRMGDKLRSMICSNNKVNDLGELAGNIASSLNSFVPPAYRNKYRSGFHMAGFNTNGLPEFWYIRNVGDDGTTIFKNYEAREDYLSGHARQNGFNGIDPGTLPGRLYRNGDIVSHVAAWEQIDNTLGALTTTLNFKRINTPEKYSEWIKFKMEVLAHFHKRFADKVWIGGPIDTLIIKR